MNGAVLMLAGMRCSESGIISVLVISVLVHTCLIIVFGYYFGRSILEQIAFGLGLV